MSVNEHTVAVVIVSHEDGVNDVMLTSRPHVQE